MLIKHNACTLNHLLNHIIKLTCIDGSSNLTSLWVRDRVKLDSLPLELLDSDEGAGGEDENLLWVHHMFSRILNPDSFFPFIVCFDLLKMDFYSRTKIGYEMPIQLFYIYQKRYFFLSNARLNFVFGFFVILVAWFSLF